MSYWQISMVKDRRNNVKISRRLSYLVSLLERDNLLSNKCLKCVVHVPGLCIPEPACVFRVTVTGCGWETGAGRPIWAPRACGATAGPVQGSVCDIRGAECAITCPISPCARHGLTGRGRRWAEHKLKIMEHFAPKELEGEEYSGRAKDRSAAGGRDCQRG